VCAETGWIPKHLLLESNDKIIAAMPLYLKYHSWGEYVFDHSWAAAYAQHGVPYYPKLVSAIPFTPSTGPRIGMLPNVDSRLVTKKILSSIKLFAEEWGASGWHLLFPQHELAQALIPELAMQRTGVQYHWNNENYANFDAFVRTFTSRKRKNLLKERRLANEKLQITRLVGAEITPVWWEFMHAMYQQTYSKRNGTNGYLTRNFFQNLGNTIGAQAMLCIAEERDKKAGGKIAAALFFFDNNTLYGRYWGCQKEYEFLHFELCYYQGIEFAIEKNLFYFDAGAQGEHKISRGFKPVEVHSSHWIRHPGFAEAIQAVLDQENRHTKDYIVCASDNLPYKTVL
jgi:uncharacterized protein|tara:strand:- start:5993 stop:7018 length:1026 start_codon:yes stop_codon:yes gene_type:complete